jgi:WD40 repeat protein
LWDLSRFPPRRTRRLLNPAPAQIQGIAFRPDGRQLVLSCGDGKARLWDMAEDRQAARPLEHASAVHAAAWSPDGALVLTGCRDGSAHLWDAAKGREVLDPLRQESQITVVAISPDGQLLLTADAVWGVRFWDRDSGLQLGPTLRHGNGVRSACFRPDGQVIATADGKGTVRVWRVPVGPLVGTPRQVRLWVEVLTGLELGDRGIVRVLAPRAVKARREELHTSGWKGPE